MDQAVIDNMSKLSLAQISKAIPAIVRLMNEPLQIGYAYKLRKTYNTLLEDYNFIVEKEHEIIAKYNGENKNNGKVSFPAANAEEAIKELNTLHELESNSVIIKLKMKPPETLIISANDIEALEPIISFDI